MPNTNYHFFKNQRWNSGFDSGHPLKSFFIKAFRIGVASIKGFNRHEGSMRACSLSYYTLLSIVPALAVVFGVAKGFGVDQYLEGQLMSQFYEQREFVNKVLEFAYSLLKSTQGGLIAGVGVIVLLWTILQLLSSVEDSFNVIWHVPRSRPFSRKLSDYLAMVLLCPFFFVASSSLFIYVVTYLSGSASALTLFAKISFHLFPFLISWVLFSFLYIFMPNTKVFFLNGIIAGICAGTVYQFIQWIYIKFQIVASSYGAIYGSFAAVPLFLAWLYASWLITLAGAEIAYNLQNDRRINRAQGEHPTSKQLLGILITTCCIKAFINAKPPLSTFDLIKLTGTNLAAVQEIVEELQNGFILTQVKYEQNEECYQPARDAKKITLQDVSKALNDSLNSRYYASSDNIIVVEKHLKALDALTNGSELNLSLEELEINDGTNLGRS